MGHNAKQGQHLIRSLSDLYARFDLHKQARSNYRQLAEQCNELKREARQDIERGRRVEQGLGSELSLDLRHRWGQVELRSKLTEYMCTVSMAAALGHQQALHAWVD